jgi:hypothetical protein
MTHSLNPLKPASLAWLVTALFLLVAPAGAQTPRRARILIDRSGSMEGFFETGQMQAVQSLLQDLSGAEGDSYYFIDTDLVPVSQSPTNFGGDTYLRNALDRALAQQPAPTILWLITDNQPSVGNQTASDQDIAQFYDRLQSDAIKRLYFFPLKLDFEGKLYRNDGHQLLAAHYEGQRGLLVYALLLDPLAQAEFERITQEFQTRFRPSGSNELQRILIKPLEQDTVTAKLIGGDKFRVENDSQLVAGEFNYGAPIKGDFKIELTSKLGQMKVSSAQIDVRVPNKFHTGDFTESEITPTFTPHDIHNFEPENKRIINVSINAPGVHIRHSPMTWWNSMRRNRGDIDGHIQVMINVPGQNFDVVSNLANEFSTTHDIYNDPSPGVQSRIYKLDDLVKKMMPQRPVDIRPRIGNSVDGMIPVRLQVLYTKRPLGLLLLLLALLALLLIVLFRLFGRRQTFRLTWDNGRYRACPDFRLLPFISQRIEVDNHTAARIKKSVSGIRVRAAKGYTVDDTKSRLVNSGGTDFSVSQEAQLGINFYFSSLSAAFSGGPAGPADGDDIFGDVSYGVAGPDGASALAGGTSGTPPVRKPTTGRSADGDALGSPETTTTNDSGSVNLDDLFP